MTTNEILIYFSIIYDFDWDKTFNAIKEKEEIKLTSEEVSKIIKEYKNNFDVDFITITDYEYPDNLKNSYKPPFVIAYKGNKELLKKNIVGVYSSNITLLKHDFANLQDNIISINNGETIIYQLGKQNILKLFGQLFNKIIIGKKGDKQKKDIIIKCNLINDNNIYVEPTTKKSFNNQLIKDGAYLIDCEEDLDNY